SGAGSLSAPPLEEIVPRLRSRASGGPCPASTAPAHARPHPVEHSHTSAARRPNRLVARWAYRVELPPAAATTATDSPPQRAATDNAAARSRNARPPPPLPGRHRFHQA